MQDLVDQILLKYKKDPNILGVMLFGSYARGTFDKYSDIDIYVLTNKPGKFARHNYVKNNIRVDTILDTTKEAINFLKHDSFSVRRNMSHMLAHGKIIYSKNGQLDKLQKTAIANLKPKTKYTKHQVLMHQYSIDDFLGECQRNLENNDSVAFGMNSDLLVNNIIELFLKIKGLYYLRPNEMMEVIQKADISYAKLLQSYYSEDDKKKKLKYLESLSKYVIDLAGGFSDNWTIK